MTAQTVLRMGHPVLQQQATAITEFSNDALRALIVDMQDTMTARQGVGLAAPQIGISQQLVIFGATQSQRYPEAESIPLTVLINPKIIPQDDTVSEMWEGCLSVPDMRGLVPRYENIKYTGYSVDGDLFERYASGFHARVVQHECDHLWGILYPQRIRHMDKFGFIEELIEAGHLEDISTES